MVIILPAILLTLTCLAALPLLAQTPQSLVDRVVTDSAVKNAERFVETDHDRIIREIIAITEIEAPPFKEAARARAFMQMLREHGLSDVEMDEEGNVMGLRKGAGSGPLIAIAAHLDTVFPEGTDVRVKRQGNRLLAPGVGDNSRGLAILLAIIRALDSGRVQTKGDILFVGNVGEEGPGDLRGIRYLFQKGPYRDKIKMFISVDGPGEGNDLVTGAVASKRYRIVFHGPGGHSYGANGIVNPAYALGNAVVRISKLQAPTNPRTTINVGVIGGGTSVNSIPNESWMEVDLRSESTTELEKLSDALLKEARTAVTDENSARSTGQGRITLEVQAIGERPAGQTKVESAIVQTASAVIQRFGMQPRYSTGSTDSNIPMSLKIPAITMDSGGTGGRAHALDEWIEVDKSTSVRGIQVVMTTLVALAGLQ